MSPHNVALVLKAFFSSYVGRERVRCRATVVAEGSGNVGGYHGFGL